MTQAHRAILLGAIEAQHRVTLVYAKPFARGPRRGKGVAAIVTRYVHPYELSINRKGNPVLWASDSLHGPKQIHSFRVDRIRSVRASQQPRKFVRVMAVMRHLVTYDYGEAPDRQITRKLKRA